MEDSGFDLHDSYIEKSRMKGCGSARRRQGDGDIAVEAGARDSARFH
jgi:hypothetical protein